VVRGEAHGETRDDAADGGKAINVNETSQGKHKSMSTNEIQRAKATVIRSVMVDLTPTEIQHYGERLAGAKILRDDITAKAKNVADDFKGQIGVKTAEIDQLARLVNDKKESRGVDCFRELHPGNRIVVIRADTGETVSSHAADLMELAQFKDEAEAERKRKAKKQDDAPDEAPVDVPSDEAEPESDGPTPTP
jgi:hypothetical protein